MKPFIVTALGIVLVFAGSDSGRPRGHRGISSWWPSTAAVALAQPQKKEALVDQVKKSIDHGVKYLRQTQRENGSWEVNIPAAVYQGGWTSLAVLALLNSGVPANDPMVAKGLTYLRSLKPTTTYVRALQTMAFVEALVQSPKENKEDLERIGDNVKWLIEARVIRNGEFIGWSYNRMAALSSDNSNTQYAMLGLHAGKRAGIKINEDIWKSIRDYYIRSQGADGHFTYFPNKSEGGPSLTMTTAGLCGLLIAGMELNAGREILQADGTATNCGDYKENLPVYKSLDWISGTRADRPDRLQFNLAQKTFYNMYGIERAGRLSGQRFLGRHDWYREGCVFLVREQHDDGSWYFERTAWDQWPVVSTSFALLFLSKGRTPVLISKMVHTPNGDRARDDLDWNNDRNDLRHLTDFASNKLFNDLPLAWQIFDMVRAAGPAPNENDLAEVTSDLLQAPILYINGHKNPRLRLSGTEKSLLKKYVDNGGFILAEACCGKREFDEGFRDLVKELWPDNKLEPLSGSHPIWTAYHPVKPGQPYKLWGLEMGCKTVLVYSPQDLSCRWESNKTNDGEVLQAFRLGANIIAYATGMEPPRPRLTRVAVVRDTQERSKSTGGYFEVVQLKHNGDHKPAPRAMSNLMDSMRRRANLDVVLKTKEMFPGKEIRDHKFLYMHGRKDFSYSDEELQYLRFNLENGGLLFADACCGQEAFDKAFRKFAQELFPKHKLERIPIDDLLFSKKLNGPPVLGGEPEALTEQNIQCRQERNTQPSNMAPWLEGIKIDGRWAIIYSKYDIGCALERHQSLDCRGYTPESALKLAQAAVLYSLWPE
jgi:hypothetical protein